MDKINDEYWNPDKKPIFFKLYDDEWYEITIPENEIIITISTRIPGYEEVYTPIIHNHLQKLIKINDKAIRSIIHEYRNKTIKIMKTIKKNYGTVFYVSN